MIKLMKTKGFTLIELLVVIAIISILTVISVSQFNTAKTKAKDTQRKADVDSVYKAVNMYYADYGHFPPQGSIVWGGEFVDGDYYYMKKVPTENILETQMCYLPNDELSSYVLFANMEGVGMTTGSYTINASTCGADNDNYNYAIPAPNETVNSFCGEMGSNCSD